MARPLSENAPIWAQRVALLCQQRDIPRSKLAEVMGKTVTTVGHYFCGRAQPSFDQLFLLASFLNTDLDSLLRDDAELTVDAARKYELQVPLLRWADVGIVELSTVQKRVTSPCQVSGFAFAVEVEGNEAAPVFIAGDTIIVDGLIATPTGSFVLWRADEKAQPEIRLYMSSQAGEVLYSVDPAQDPRPVVLGKAPLFLQKIMAKVTLY